MSSLGLSIRLEGLDYEVQQRRCRSVGSAKHCYNLLATTCDGACAWETAFSLAHSFEGLRQHSHLFIKGADKSTETVGELQFVTRRKVQNTSECSVKGCRNTFPENRTLVGSSNCESGAGSLKLIAFVVFMMRDFDVCKDTRVHFLSSRSCRVGWHHASIKQEWLSQY